MEETERKEQRLTVERFHDILCETYKRDTQPPPIWGLWGRRCEQESAMEWAADELKYYISGALYPREEASIDEFIELTTKFKSKMLVFARKNRNTSQTFYYVCDGLNEILDLLEAMA